MNLDHLDDPTPFLPDDSFRAAVRGEGRRRRTRRRLALAGGSVLTSVAVVIAAVAGYGLWRTSQVDRVDVEFVAPPVTLDRPFNLLLLGSDHRAGEDDGVVGSRSDTMIVVRLDPGARTVTMLSLPRDLVVTPLEGGAPDRLNTAFDRGGAAEAVATVEQRLGIPLSAYVEVDFEGLVDLVDETGGLPLAVSQEVRDPSTGLDLQASSCTTLDGSTTLALVRSRHLELRQTDGRYVEDATSDLGRMARQQTVLQLVLPRLGELTSGIGGLDAAIDLATEHVTVDDRLDLATLLAIGRWAVADPPPVVERQLLPLRGTVIEGRSVLVLGHGASEVVAAVGGTLPPDVAAQAAALGDAPGATGVIETEVGAAPFGPCP